MNWTGLDVKKCSKFQLYKAENIQKMRNVCRKWGGNETLATLQACSGQTMRIHFSSTQKTGNSAEPGLSVQFGAQTVIHLPSKPCALTQFLYLGILLPFCPFFFFFVFFPFSSKISLPFPFSFNIFTYYNPYSLLTIFFTFYWHMVDLCFGPATSFFLELLVIALCSSPVACWTPSDLGRGRSSSSAIPFHHSPRVLQARILEWVAISSSNGPYFVRTLHYDLSGLGGPARHGS